MKRLPLFMVLLASVAMPAAAFAQSSDAAYCQALMDKYRAVVGNSVSSNDVPVAMAKCQAGDTAAGIPVLEQALKDAKVTLPPRK